MDGAAIFLYLVQICTRFGSYSLNYLHILNEELTSSCDGGRVSTIRPGCAESREHQAFSPRRVQTCRLRVHMRHLTASNEAVEKNSQGSNPVCEMGKKLTDTQILIS